MKKNYLLTSALTMLFPLFVIGQDIIVKQDGIVLNVYNVDESRTSYYYTTEPNSASFSRVLKDSVLIVKCANGTVLRPSEFGTTAQPEVDNDNNSNYPIIDENDIHGSLIAEGNCVYIPTDSPKDYEQTGQKRLKEFFKEWAYWKVVSKPEQAHFILQFTTQTSGHDTSHLLIRPRKYYKSFPIVVWKPGVGWSILGC